MTVARYETREEAQTDAELLAEHGLRPRIVGEETGPANVEGPARVPPIELQVSEQVAFAAGQMLHALDPPEQEDQTERDVSKEDVVFRCEECGAMLQFPADRRGKVDVCRHCGDYVDVPK